MAFVRNRKESHYSAKISFGEGTRELLAAMTFDDAYEPNVFHAALNSDRGWDFPAGPCLTLALR